LGWIACEVCDHVCKHQDEGIKSWFESCQRQVDVSLLEGFVRALFELERELEFDRIKQHDAIRKWCEVLEPDRVVEISLSCGSASALVCLSGDPRALEFFKRLWNHVNDMRWQDMIEELVESAQGIFVLASSFERRCIGYAMNALHKAGANFEELAAECWRFETLHMSILTFLTITYSIRPTSIVAPDERRASSFAVMLKEMPRRTRAYWQNKLQTMCTQGKLFVAQEWDGLRKDWCADIQRGRDKLIQARINVLAHDDVVLLMKEWECELQSVTSIMRDYATEFGFTEALQWMKEQDVQENPV
jgi:hypothetical protein